MIYPDSFEHKIGFDGVRSHISSLCTSPIGSDRCAAMRFSEDFDEVRRELDRVYEMLAIISGSNDFPAGGIHDRRALLTSLRVPGTWPSEAELGGLRATLATMGDIALFFEKHKNQDTGVSHYPALDTLAEDIQAFPAVTAAIDRIIDRHGEIKDNASVELAEIRRKMASAQAGIGSAMRRVMAEAVREGYIDPDAKPSMRDGRLTIPVAPMYKRKVPGIVHDESATGKTFFIEPAEVVEANNRLRELHIAERHEIVRILQGLADVIRPHIDDILGAYELLGIFDFIRAKAEYARLTGAEKAQLDDKPELEWYGARHPGLTLTLERQGKTIVPLDIHLDEKGRILLISGPNAGGKSVTLKTVAIVQYMTQCGVPPTLYSNSHVGFFKNIFIDIGDDQSIEDDLSTYSSHLKNMKFFLTHSNRHTLALIDEFGTGTEPQIGGALAQALLKQFNARGIWGVITTHYHNLKQYAEETPGLINGSMLYDNRLMQPTFRLDIGRPGSSFAIEIARKSGLPEEVIADAREIVGSDYVNMDKYLLEIARDRRYWENKRHNIRQREKQIEETLSRYSDDAEHLREQRRVIIAEAREEAKRILDNSNAAIERTIREIRSAQADKEATRQARQRLAEDRRRLDTDDSNHPLLDKIKPKKKKQPDKSKDKSAKQPLAVGDTVVLDDGRTPGTIESISGNNATVVFGQMKTSVKLSRLKHTVLSTGQNQSVKVSYLSSDTSAASRERQLQFSHEIDVRGMRADEAVQAIMYYIDDALQFNAGRVRILHGTGTGALRLYIRRYLESVEAVKSYHDEDVRFGGAGITVVEF